MPGQSALRSTRAEGLLLGLRLFRLLSLLRFLSHSILSRFNGLNATPRHALWRRANLATSSRTFPPDSRAAAAHCHDAMMALSTTVMRFRGHFLKFSGSAATRRRDRRRKARANRVNATPKYPHHLPASAPIHQNKTTVPIVWSRSDSVKRRRCTLAAKRGLSQAESTQRWGTT